MAYPEGKERRSRQAEKAESESRKPARFRIEFGVVQLFVYTSCLVALLGWMFVFGVLVGRGIPLVDSKDTSMQAQFLRFLGLGGHPVELPEHASATWDVPGAVVETAEDPQTPAGTNTASPTLSLPAGQQSTPERKKPAPAATASSGAATERYTLLVSSLKSRENAERLAQQLRGKGYEARMESIDKPELGRWNRVLVGNFDTREEAVAFAARFNQKEHLEGLVIRGE